VIVVTARGRLVERAGGRPEAWPDLLLEQVSGALEGGADLVQVREPDLGAGLLTQFLRRLFLEIPGSAKRVVVNDRADVAWAAGAAGVHLTERSISVEDVRSLSSADKKWVMGRSVHDPDTAARNRGADYLIAGTIRPSASKAAGIRLLGWAGLEAVVAAAAGTPVVAIGGLGPADVAEALARGATGLAGIGCFLPDLGRPVASSVRDHVHRVREAFPR
jgi:thiamine-phosphate pyrophosphorylase